MTAKIQVRQLADGVYEVRVIEGATQSSYRVTLRTEDYDRLTQKNLEPAELVKRSFEFLLERESKESILSRFDLSVISRYFPEFEGEIKRKLSKS
jgi:hypothetical protein